MPSYFNPYQYPQQNFYPQTMPSNQSAPMNVPQNVQQMPDNNFVPAPSEDFARNFPVGYGKSVNFKDENAPYIYVKTMGFSQLDNPVFEKYRLVKEEPTVPQNDAKKVDVDKLSYDKLKDDIDEIKGQIRALQEDVRALQEKSKTRMVKKEAEDDE